ncbi:hypothetical protein SARC_02127 [Sphaeroforma arctica JP610]|uniref:Uncharacterized protein n=1 Tax=Sphaeroforma arctica JP610 TaxID=667725 RepID=A0A0L0G9L2_9EUKA|nr:hypothetical protein SARC_02127 [Sphaeroforma arctica JP610]KNC85717.1 hypothetical protein SARC_02127 [Sphaeroforma arctica JP610]|eukprot:XP_014159619.1 hypothetical protein SARC_02127 [Sphaeroforma arctica JP610]
MYSHNTELSGEGHANPNWCDSFYLKFTGVKWTIYYLTPPPGTSDEHLTIVQALKACNPDGAIIVTTPQDVALATIRKELNFCSKMKVKVLGVLENMSGFQCPCCRDVYDLWPNASVEKLCTEYGVPYLGKVPVDPSLFAMLCCSH